MSIREMDLNELNQKGLDKLKKIYKKSVAISKLIDECQELHESTRGDDGKYMDGNFMYGLAYTRLFNGLRKGIKFWCQEYEYREMKDIKKILNDITVEDLSS